MHASANVFFDIACIHAYMWQYLVIILIIVLLWHFVVRNESFKSCPCDKPAWVSPAGSIIINPYLYPGGEAACTQVGKDMPGPGPLTHLNTPDHAVLTN
jgi:hypothetical protein